MATELNETWIHGKYPSIDAEINTKLPFVFIAGYYWQGDEADEVIKEIHKIWSDNDMTVEQAITQWASNLG